MMMNIFKKTQGAFKGVGFTLPSGIKIKNSYGYVRATGNYKIEDNVEKVELYDINNGKLEYLQVTSDDPFIMLASL